MAIIAKIGYQSILLHDSAYITAISFHVVDESKIMTERPEKEAT